jgi:hypothetical protein
MDMDFSKFCGTLEYFFEFPEGFYPPQLDANLKGLAKTGKAPTKTVQYCRNILRSKTASIEAKNVAKNVLRLNASASKTRTFCLWQNANRTISAKIPFDTPAQLALFLKQTDK